MSEKDLKNLVALSIAKGQVNTENLYLYERYMKVVETTIMKMFSETEHSRVVSESYQIINTFDITYGDGVPDVKIETYANYSEATKKIEKIRFGKIVTIEEILILTTHITCGSLKLTLNHDESVEINNLLVNHWKAEDLKKVSHRIKLLEKSIKL